MPRTLVGAFPTSHLTSLLSLSLSSQPFFSQCNSMPIQARSGAASSSEIRPKPDREASNDERTSSPLQNCLAALDLADAAKSARRKSFERDGERRPSSGLLLPPPPFWRRKVRGEEPERKSTVHEYSRLLLDYFAHHIETLAVAALRGGMRFFTFAHPSRNFEFHSK